MKTYVEIVFDGVSPELSEILVARLSEVGFDGFLEEGGSLKAYMEKQGLDREFLNSIGQEYGLAIREHEIEEQNWNASWESSFDPVVVEDFVSVRADFHEVVKGVEYEIIITPKMSFGTGHHATTWLMMKAMRDFFLQGSLLQGSLLQGSLLQGSLLGGGLLGGRNVVDYGTGTGILAILAEKMGAAHVLAIDNDTWSIENATENLARNGCSKVELVLGEEIPQDRQFDLVLANINKHILIGHVKSICDAVKPGGILIMSGILREDLEDMESSFGIYLGKPVTASERNNWLMIAFPKGSSVEG